MVFETHWSSYAQCIWSSSFVFLLRNEWISKKDYVHRSRQLSSWLFDILSVCSISQSSSMYWKLDFKWRSRTLPQRIARWSIVTVDGKTLQVTTHTSIINDSFTKPTPSGLWHCWLGAGWTFENPASAICKSSPLEVFRWPARSGAISWKIKRLHKNLKSFSKPANCTACDQNQYEFFGLFVYLSLGHTHGSFKLILKYLLPNIPFWC